MVEKGVDVNFQYTEGGTALHVACANGRHDISEILLEANADPSICSNEKKTPLMKASAEGHVKTVKSLALAPQFLAKQLTLSQQGDRLCPPQY